MSKDSEASARIMATAIKLEEEPAAVDHHGAVSRWQRVRIEGMVIECFIGIHPSEHQAPQRVSIDVELIRREPDEPTDEIYARVMCYETVIDKVRAIVAEGHIKLIETLAERIAEACHLEYPAITALNVGVNKIDIFPDVAKVGVRLERVFSPAADHPPRNQKP